MRISTLLVTLLLMTVIFGCSGNGSSNPAEPSGDGVLSPLEGIRAVNTELEDVRIGGESALTSSYIKIDAGAGEIPLEIIGNREGSISVRVSGGELILPDGQVSDTYSGENREIGIMPLIDQGLVELNISFTGETEHSRRYWLAVDLDDAQPIPPYEEATAISPDGDTLEVVKDEILIGLLPGTSEADLNQLLSALDMQMLQRIVDTDIYRIGIPSGTSIFAAIKTVEQSPIVEYGEPNFIRRATIIPNDPAWGNKWDLSLMDGPQGWDIYTGDTDLIVGVIDSGVDRDHPDLAAKVVDGEDFVSGGDGLGGEVPGDGIDNNGNFMIDENVGHGTHVGGIIGAVSNNGTGTTGVDWGCRLMGLRVFPANGDGGAASSTIMAALQYAKNTPNMVAVNMSLSGPSSSNSEQIVMNQVFNAGVVIVAAAGNNGSSQYHYPSSYDNVICVAATTSTDKKASFSQHHDMVDVCAPGQSIYSTYFNNNYAIMSGTSMACPEVTGLVSLVRGFWTTHTTQEVVDQVVYTADYIYDKNPSYIGHLGTGRINIHKALSQQLQPEYNIIARKIDDDPVGLTEGNSDRFFNPGEVIGLGLTVRNDGIKDANDPVATLEIVDPYVHVLNGEIGFPDIAKTQVVGSTSNFLFSIDNDCPDGYEVAYTIIFDDSDDTGPHLNEGTWKIFKNDYTPDSIWLEPTDYPEDMRIFKGVNDQALIKIEVSGSTNYGLIDEFTLYKFGSVANETITDIRLYHDTDGDSRFDTDGTDLQLSVGSYINPGYSGQFDDLNDPYSGNPGGPVNIPNDPVVFGPESKAVFTNINLPTSSTQNNAFFIVIDLDISAVSGSTLQIGIMNESDVTLRLPDAIDPDCLPLLSGEFTISSTWQMDKKITSGNSAHSWRPEGVTDSAGNVFIVIDDDRNTDFDIYFLKSIDFGAEFETDKLLTASSANQFYPQIAVDSADVLHVVYYTTQFGSSNREIMYLRSLDQGETWDDPVRLTNAAGNSRVADIAIGPDDILHVCWIDDRAIGEGIFYMKSENGGDNWSSDKKIANVQYWDEFPQPAMAIGGDNSVHIAWFRWVVSGQYIVGYDVNYVKSNDTGDNFGSVKNLTPGSGGWDYAVRIAADPDGNPYVVYHHWSSSAYDIYAKYSVDGGDNFLTKNLTPSGNTYAVRPDIFIDQNGMIDVVYKDNLVGVSTVYHIYSETGINGFSDPVQIAFGAEAETRDEWPRVLRGPEKNIYSFWADSRTGQHEIFFNRYLY